MLAHASRVAALGGICLSLSGALAQVGVLTRTVPAREVPVANEAHVAAARDAGLPTKPRILWIKNEQTGQVVFPGAGDAVSLPIGDTGFAAREALNDEPQARVVYDSFTLPGGRGGLNLNWNYPQAYTDPNFAPAPGLPALTYSTINVSSEVSDLDQSVVIVGGDKLSILFDPWRAETWPGDDRNVRQTLRQYQSAFASVSDQLEIRICRIYFLSKPDVDAPYDSVTNRWEVDAQLSFGFVSPPFLGVESTFNFDFTGFDPPIQVRGGGLVMTHWLQTSVPEPCFADFNDDGQVDDTDFVQFVAQYLVFDCNAPEMPGGCRADLNADDFVDDQDFVLFVRSYLDLFCPSPTAVTQVYALLSGGRFRWSSPFPAAPLDPVPEVISAPGWPLPNSLIQVGAGDPNCRVVGCEPTLSWFQTGRTGLGKVTPLNEEVPANQRITEYTRFVNDVFATDGALVSLFYFDLETAPNGLPDANTRWGPQETLRFISIEEPTAP